MVLSTHGCPYLTLGAVSLGASPPLPPLTIYLLYLFFGYLIGGELFNLRVI